MAILNKTGITNGGTIQAEHITRVIDALTGVSTDSLVLTGSLQGSATSAQTVNTITSALNYEFYPTFVDADNGAATPEIVYTDAGIRYNPSTNILTTTASRAVSSSFATTASFALNAGGSGFPFVGVAQITGSLIVSGSNNDLTVNTRNTTITTIDNINIDSTSLNINANTEIIGRAGGTEWVATKYSIIDWSLAGEGSNFDGQFVLPLQAPLTPRIGSMYYDTSFRRLFVFDGINWKEFIPAP
jgi:hypothetical protein